MYILSYDDLNKWNNHKQFLYLLCKKYLYNYFINCFYEKFKDCFGPLLLLLLLLANIIMISIYYSSKVCGQ